ncbi:MAG: TIGR02265 family protein [Myxococcales bacterium]
MSEVSRLLTEVDAYCHLQARLELLPATARMRGVYFRSIEVVLERAGLLDRYRDLFPTRRATVLWYPNSEFLEQLVVGAALLTEPSRVHEGMLEIGRVNARVFAESVLGKLLVRVLSREPRDLLRQAIIGHRQGSNHATWTLSFPDERTACMEFSDEFNYIESYLLGAARGTFEAIELPAQVDAELRGPFRGRHVIRW